MFQITNVLIPFIHSKPQTFPPRSRMIRLESYTYKGGTQLFTRVKTHISAFLFETEGHLQCELLKVIYASFRKVIRCHSTGS